MLSNYFLPHLQLVLKPARHCLIVFTLGGGPSQNPDSKILLPEDTTRLRWSGGHIWSTRQLKKYYENVTSVFYPIMIDRQRLLKQAFFVDNKNNEDLTHPWLRISKYV